MSLSSGKISKREFLRYSLIGTGGIAASMFNPGLFAAKNGFAKLNIKLPPEKPWKWSKEAVYYGPHALGVECQLCPLYCIIKPGKSGACKIKKNYDNKLMSIGYGNPCAIHIDPVEKKPLYHFLPSSEIFSLAVAGCNLTCLNCQNWTISQSSPADTRNYELMPDKAVEECLNHDCKLIAYTYSEPTAFFEYMYDTAKIAHEKGVRNVMVSNGFINEKPLRELCKYIDAANIDLKSFDNDIYLKLNGGALQPILDTLKIMKEEGVWLEITNLIVPTWTDDLDMIKKMCDWLVENGLEENPLHFSRFHPLYKLTQLPPTPVDILVKAHDIAVKAGIKYVYIGNVPGSDGQNTFCPECKKILVERRGYRILQNNILNGKCKYCQSKISGVWT